MSDALHYKNVCEDYLAQLLHERGLSKKTWYSYKSHLQRFETWVITKGKSEPLVFTDAFTMDFLRKWLYHLSSSGLRPRTIRGNFNALRGFGAFAVEMGILKESPAHTIKLPKKDAAKRALVSTEEITLLLDAADRQRNPINAAIAKAMLSVLVYTGVRSAELLNLKVSDINLDKQTLLVAHGKGEKSRLLHPCEECMTAIRRWLSLRPADHATDWLWTYGKSRRYAEHGLHSVLETVKTIAGLADHANIKPHSIRHAFATRLMDNGAGIKSIQAALGHAQAETTLIYLHAAEQPAKAMAHLATIPAKVDAERVEAEGNQAHPTPREAAQVKQQRSAGILARRRMAPGSRG